MYNVLSKPFFQWQIIARFPNKAGQVVRVFCMNGVIFVATNPFTGVDADKIAAFPAEIFATYKAIVDPLNANFMKVEATFTDADILKLANQSTLELKLLINAGFASFKVLIDLPSLSSFVENHETMSVEETFNTIKMVKYVQALSELLNANGIGHVGFNTFSAI